MKRKIRIFLVLCLSLVCALCLFAFRIHVYTSHISQSHFANYFVPRRWSGLTMTTNHQPYNAPDYLGATGNFCLQEYLFYFSH